MIDKWQKPTPSMMKAVRLLIEHYQVYFVAPAYTTDAAQFATTQAWLTEYVDTPAWCHTIYTNQRQLLYGDYLIETASPLELAKEGQEPDLVATRIVYGSDTFKTWDDIISYFERLGGQ